ncbi:hypothetical protein AAG906_011968 [Vitis piasezkii]
MKGQSLSFFTFFYTSISFSMVLRSSTAADTITPNQSLVDGMTLVSTGQSFELGFFSPGDSNSRYLGIWYKKFPNTIVWVANREKPITDRYGVLSIDSDGNLILLDQTKRTIWSSISSRLPKNPVVQLLESGNFVLRDASDDWYATSWRNASDPSPGDFTYRIDKVGLPQIVLRKGSEKKYRTGPWNGLRFSDEAYYLYELKDNLSITRLTLNELGSINRFVLRESSTEWAIVYTVQNDLCDNYGHCGANGFCRIGNTPICECLDGFVPKSQNEWEFLNWTSGCIRRTPLDCQKGEGFIEVKGVKLPDLLDFWVNKRMTLKECRAECLKNCSCTAYANSNISKGGSGCLMWFGNLIDVREFHAEESEQTVYVRMPASELESRRNSSQKRKHLVIVVLVSMASVVLILGLVFWCIIWMKRWKKRDTGPEMQKDEFESPLFSLATVASATNNFSYANMIGEGGFGPVYKGTLGTGQEIAVKRLSNNSGQGLQEFKNEVILISRLQHRNLVRLLGCCIEREERVLIYEYMPNRSLDYFIFDQMRRVLLPWQKRLDIILGIARGLLYLHQDSRLRIIHRDLKTSNILLDSELNPKISDFGIARIFGGDQIEAKTKRVIGTYGYMSPEYAVDGKFSVKSDVFSLGVLLLEIVWLLWNENRALELMEPCLVDSYVESQVLRCIQVDRPSMSSVVLMLVNEEITLPQPKQPGFFIERGPDINEGHHTENAVTITTLEAR